MTDAQIVDAANTLIRAERTQLRRALSPVTIRWLAGFLLKAAQRQKQHGSGVK